MLLSKDEEFIKAHPPVLPEVVVEQDVPLWTDHAHNLFQILYRN